MQHLGTTLRHIAHAIKGTQRVLTAAQWGKQHLEEIAEILRDVPNKTIRQNIADKFFNIFLAANIQFEPDYFFQKCGLTVPLKLQ